MLKAGIALILLHTSLTASAVECPAPEGSSPVLARIDGASRLTFLRTKLLISEPGAHLWTTLWLTAFSTALVAEVGVAPEFSTTTRWSLYLSAAKTVVALGSIVVIPARANEGRDFDAWLTLHSTTESECSLVHEGELRLMNQAAQQARGHGWLLHSGGLALNVAASLVLGLVFHQWVQAAVSAAVGEVVGETMMWTRPRGAEDALVRYRNGDLDTPAVDLRVQGASLEVTF